MTALLDLDALAELLADKLTARIDAAVRAALTDAHYDQDHPPTGLTPRAFLDAARRGAFPTEKLGRKVRARRADVDAWARRRAVVAKPTTPANDNPGADPDLEELAGIVDLPAVPPKRTRSKR